MKFGSKTTTLVCLLATVGGTSIARSDDLLTVFDQAVVNDPQIREADATRLAQREARPQAIGSLLPQFSASGSRGRDWSDNNSSTAQELNGVVVPSDSRIDSRNDSKAWSLSLRQSVFNWGYWSTLKSAGHQVAQAEANYVAAQQNLVQRVAQLYFAVLNAEETVTANEAARDALNRQLEQANRRYEVGLIAITDVQQTRADHDNAAAQVIAAKRTLSSAQEQLRAVIGVQPASLNKPADNMPLITPVPANIEDWVKTSMEQNATLLSSRLAADIARDNVHTVFGGHLPQIDLVAGRNYNERNGDQTFTTNISTQTANDSSGYSKSISLQVTVPIFSGGITQSRVRQAQYNWIAAKERLERTSRDTERQARDAYIGVVSNIAQVQALKQSVESFQTALKATEAGYEVGTQTTVDVLNARRSLIAAQTSYSNARYTYLNTLIALRLAAGDLDRKSLEEINQWLTLTAPTIPAPATPGAAQ